MNNGALNSGAVYMFVHSEGVWLQRAYIKAGNTESGDDYGVVALSSSGDTMAVGAPGEYGSATGIGGNWNDNGASRAGAVYLY